MPREIKAEVNTGVSLVECLWEIDEHKAKHEKKLTAYDNGDFMKFTSILG